MASHYRGIENIQAGIGDQAGLMIRDISTFVGGMLWAFLLNWKLAIVVSALLPLVSMLSGLNIKVIFFRLEVSMILLIFLLKWQKQ